MNTIVLGAGESGVGAALLAKVKGHNVFVSDKGLIAEKYKNELVENGIEFEEGKHSEERILNTNQVIKSPGIPDKVALIQQLKEKGIPVISEIEFAGKYTDAKLIGITGSNGKTTTTLLTYHLLKTAGLDVVAAGNVGNSFAREILVNPKEIYILELSSFQLDGLVDFKLDIAALLNITPDHLDRYEYKMDNYIRSKFRIALNQGVSDLLFYDKEDDNITTYLKDNQFWCQRRPIVKQMIGRDWLHVGESDFDMRITQLRGKHNHKNALFAVHIAKELGISDELIQQGLNTFKPVPHRMEVVATVEGVEYINDSKATNVDAVFYALQAMNRPIVWVVGGKDKGNDYKSLMRLVQQKVKAIVCLGADNTTLLDVFGELGVEIIETQTAKDAVHESKALATAGDVVLLSPACASFDLFKNYMERGDLFREAVLQLV